MGFLDTFFGLMADVGLGNPLSRAVTFGSIGFATQYFVKPSISYNNIETKTGTKSIPKEFVLTSQNKSPAATTWMPWYLWPAIFALIGGLFI